MDILFSKMSNEYIVCIPMMDYTRKGLMLSTVYLIIHINLMRLEW
jgi:hypothetical protein